MSGGVADFGFAEVGTDPVGLFLQPVEAGADRTLQFGDGFWAVVDATARLRSALRISSGLSSGL
jgi:hypothetical protein